jgi:putative flippase GtrA
MPSLKNIKETPKQLIRYLVVGGSTALGDFLLFLFFYRALQFDIMLANITAVSTATCLNFFLNREWSFHSGAGIKRSLILYFALFLFNTAFGTLAIRLLTGLGLPAVWAKLMMMALITAWNFILYRKVIFPAPC